MISVIHHLIRMAPHILITAFLGIGFLLGRVEATIFVTVGLVLAGFKTVESVLPASFRGPRAGDQSPTKE